MLYRQLHQESDRDSKMSFKKVSGTLKVYESEQLLITFRVPDFFLIRLSKGRIERPPRAPLFEVALSRFSQQNHNPTRKRGTAGCLE
jgi:hypothetical protein